MTYKQLAQELPDGIRELFLEEFERQKCPLTMNPAACALIDFAFDWDESEMGFDFWECVDEDWKYYLKSKTK